METNRRPCARCGRACIPRDLFHHGRSDLWFCYGCYTCSPFKTKQMNAEEHADALLAYARTHAYGALEHATGPDAVAE